MLPRKIPKAPKRSSRWRSQAHCNFVRGHACSVCDSTAGIEVAHVRLGSGAGMGQKPDDWRTVSLCHECHRIQHEIGEWSFWATPGKLSQVGNDFCLSDGNIDRVEALIEAFCKASPKAAEIRAIRKEREGG